jgi:glyoxylase-like metal-dependent hydrolase (beta-lactamase superfamily II)
MSRITPLALGFANAILVQETGAIMVDTGAPATPEIYHQFFARCAIDPQDIRLIVITHGHTDHFAHAHELRELTGAPVLCHSKALAALRTAKNPPVHPRNELGESVLRMIAGKEPPASRPLEPDILIDGEYDLTYYGVAGKIIPTPGHSDCSVSVVLDSGAVMVGDMIVSSPFTGHATIAYLAEQPELLFDNVRRLLPLGDLFYSGHGGPFSRQQVQVALQAET